jgi:hypothetical protein
VVRTVEETAAGGGGDRVWTSEREPVRYSTAVRLRPSHRPYGWIQPRLWI